MKSSGGPSPVRSKYISRSPIFATAIAATLICCPEAYTRILFGESFRPHATGVAPARSLAMIERAFRILAFTAALLLPIAAQGAPAQMTRVPALFQNGQVYLRVSLNNAAPIWMAFDVN